MLKKLLLIAVAAVLALATPAFAQQQGGGGGGGGGTSGVFGPIITVPSSTGSKFTTWINQSSATETDTLVGMSFQVPNNGNEFSGLIKLAPAPPYHAVFLLIPELFGPTTSDWTDENGITVGWYDGTSKLDTFLLYGRGAGNFQTFHYTFSAPDTLAANTAIGPQMYGSGTLIWFRLGNDGTNITFDTSNDGLTWTNEYTTTIAEGYLLAYTYLAIGMTNFATPWAFTLASYTD